MLDLRFNREALANLPQKDLMIFSERLFSDYSINKSSNRVHVNSFSIEEDASNKLMEKVTIKLQVFNKKGEESKFLFENFRAKNFCCQNIIMKRL